MDPSLVIAGLALVGSFTASYLTYRSSKNATRVGLEANAFQRAVKAEEKSEAAEKRADAIEVRLRSMERHTVSLESRLRYIIHLIHDPYMDLPLLRERVPLNFNSFRREDEE